MSYVYCPIIQSKSLQIDLTHEVHEPSFDAISEKIYIYIYTQPENKIDVKTHMLYKLYLVPSKIVSIYRFAMEFYQTQEEHIKELENSLVMNPTIKIFFLF